MYGNRPISHPLNLQIHLQDLLRSRKTREQDQQGRIQTQQALNPQLDHQDLQSRPTDPKLPQRRRDRSRVMTSMRDRLLEQNRV